MSRVRVLGIESFVLNSYEGWDETDVGVQFCNCDFKVFSGLSRFDGYVLHLNYADSRVEIYDGDLMVHTQPMKLVLI